MKPQKLDKSILKLWYIRAAIPFFAIAFIVIFLCFMVYRILYYKTSGYELTEKEIKCNRGVLFRKRSVVDYRKVHYDAP